MLKTEQTGQPNSRRISFCFAMFIYTPRNDNAVATRSAKCERETGSGGEAAQEGKSEIICLTHFAT